MSIQNSNCLLILASYKSNSLLQLLGFNKNIKYSREHNIVNTEYPGRLEGDYVEYILLSVTKPVEADQTPLVTHITSIFVYTDLIEYVIVGNSLAPLLWYLPVQSTWRNIDYWNFNPAYYIRVKEENIRSLSLKLCNELCDVINFDSGNLISQLNFRQIRYSKNLYKHITLI